MISKIHFLHLQDLINSLWHFQGIFLTVSFIPLSNCKLRNSLTPRQEPRSVYVKFIGLENNMVLNVAENGGFWHLRSWNFIRQNEVHWFFRLNDKIVSFSITASILQKKLWPLFIGRVQLSQWTLLWIGFNCPKTAESQWGGCLLLTTTSPVT